MRVLINAVSIREGGSRVVFQKLLDGWLEGELDCIFLPIVNRHLLDEVRIDERVQSILVDDRLDSPARIRIWYERDLPRLATEHRADILFSQTNYLPLRRLPCPSLLLVQHAGHFSELFRELMEQYVASLGGRLRWRLKKLWVRQSLARASHVTVQTETLASEIVHKAGVDRDRITVVPHGPGLVAHGKPKPFPERRPWQIGCITKFGAQKNFQTLFAAISQLCKRHPVRLVMSLDESTSEYVMVRQQIERAGIADVVDNYGELNADKMQGIYDQLNLFVFPSLCESFGFPLVEAMARGLPVVAADIASTREVGGDAPLLFGPNDAQELADQLNRLMTDSELFAHCAFESTRVAGKYSWQRAGSETMTLMHRLTGQGLGDSLHDTVATTHR